VPATTQQPLAKCFLYRWYAIAAAAPTAAITLCPDALRHESFHIITQAVPAGAARQSRKAFLPACSAPKQYEGARVAQCWSALRREKLAPHVKRM
jgi:hypothetical protein